MKIINTPAFSVSISVDENGNIIDSKTSIMYNQIEQKQETLEEVAKKMLSDNKHKKATFETMIEFAKWQKEQDKK